MRELSDVNQLRDATESATDRLVHLQRRGTSCTPTPPLGPESVLPRLKIDLAAKIELAREQGSLDYSGIGALCPQSLELSE